MFEDLKPKPKDGSDLIPITNYDGSETGVYFNKELLDYEPEKMNAVIGYLRYALTHSITASYNDTYLSILTTAPLNVSTGTLIPFPKVFFNLEKSEMILECIGMAIYPSNHLEGHYDINATAFHHILTIAPMDKIVTPYRVEGCDRPIISITKYLSIVYAELMERYHWIEVS